MIMVPVCALICLSHSQRLPAHGIPLWNDRPYKVLSTSCVGGKSDIFAAYFDPIERRLYLGRGGSSGVDVYSVDPFALIGSITGGGDVAVVDPATHIGFCNGPQITMFDAHTLLKVKKLPVPAIFGSFTVDPHTQRVFTFVDWPPSVSVLSAKSGSLLQSIKLPCYARHAVFDGDHTIYFGLWEKNQVGVIDTQSMRLIKTFDLGPLGLSAEALGFDSHDHVLLVGCWTPPVMAMLDTDTGKLLSVAPLGLVCNELWFAPTTDEVIWADVDSRVHVLKRDGFALFTPEQILPLEPPQDGYELTAFDPKRGQLLVVLEKTKTIKMRRIGVPDSTTLLVVGR